MVAEPWIHKMRKKKKPPPPPSASASSSSSSTIGILSFELANAMSRAVHLHRSLSDPEISRLLTQILSSPSVRSLVSADDRFLLSLAVFEKLDDLNRVAAVASRLGRRHCSFPALVGFEHVYSDLLAGRIQTSTSAIFLYAAGKDLDSAVRKMERYVTSTASLYAELEVLSDLEHSAKKFPDTDETRRAFDQKIHGQRHDIKQIRGSSLWNQSFDRAVLLLARVVCTIHARIRTVFGEYVLGVGALNSGRIVSSNVVQRSGLVAISSVNFHREGLRLNCRANPSRLFLNCLNLGGSASSSWNDNEVQLENESSIIPFSGENKNSGGGSSSIEVSKSGFGPFSGENVNSGGSSSSIKVSKSGFGPKSRLTMLAPHSTVGGSCLALHYANVIIIIEKLLRYPHLVGEEARDDLYQMLPSSLRLALRKSLKSYVKNLAIYDASLAHDWKEAMERILGWLAPMAHNMIRWQTERNFEQQQIVLRESVLLLQTLYFADREKTEAAICELLVGLNYICRYEQQQNALLDCTSSMDFDDCMDWQQMQYNSSEIP